MDIYYSFIVPVYNRPDEVKELLRSMWKLQYEKPFEVVLVEDGSTVDSQGIAESFSQCLEISYYQKPNTGPGDSRNFGMKKAKGNYFLILDSDVLLPPDYLAEVDKALQDDFVHCFGGPDAAHSFFTDLQKAINYAMTSYVTTGGIRGRKQLLGEFEPRSFNMGLSKEAFEASGGFGSIHPGEDPDLSLRLRKMGFKTVLFPKARVFHKRRIDWGKFYQQVYKFGLVRPILNEWHPESRKITYWFPAIFSLGLLFSIVLFFLNLQFFFYCYLFYFLFIFFHAGIQEKSVKIGAFAVWASLVQFFGYGLGFSRSTIYIRILKEIPEKRFPKLFFKHGG